MAAHQALPSLGFSRHEYWSGLPFPSPVHESEKWKRSHSVVSNSQRPHGLQPTRFLHPWDFPGRSTGVGCHSLPSSHLASMSERASRNIFLLLLYFDYLDTCNRIYLLRTKVLILWQTFNFILMFILLTNMYVH